MTARTLFTMPSATDANTSSSNATARPRGIQYRSRRVTKGRQMYARRAPTHAGTIKLLSAQNREAARTTGPAVTTTFSTTAGVVALVARITACAPDALWIPGGLQHRSASAVE